MESLALSEMARTFIFFNASIRVMSEVNCPAVACKLQTTVLINTCTINVWIWGQNKSPALRLDRHICIAIHVVTHLPDRGRIFCFLPFHNLMTFKTINYNSTTGFENKKQVQNIYSPTHVLLVDSGVATDVRYRWELFTLFICENVTRYTAEKWTNFVVYLNVEQPFFLAFFPFIQWSFTPFSHKLTHTFNIVLGSLYAFLKIIDHVSCLLNVFPHTFRP